MMLNFCAWYASFPHIVCFCEIKSCERKKTKKENSRLMHFKQLFYLSLNQSLKIYTLGLAGAFFPGFFFVFSILALICRETKRYSYLV